MKLQSMRFNYSDTIMFYQPAIEEVNEDVPAGYLAREWMSDILPLFPKDAHKVSFAAHLSAFALCNKSPILRAHRF